MARSEAVDRDALALVAGERPLTVKEAAARMGLSESMTRRLCRTGKLPYTRAGSDMRIPPRAIDRYFAANLVDPSAPRPQKARALT